MTSGRTFKQLLSSYRVTLLKQGEITGTSENDCGLILLGNDILEDLSDEMEAVAREEGAEEERLRILSNATFLNGCYVVPSLILSPAPMEAKK